ncbi:MAG: beta-lactamase family protein [Acidimicrobiales bacterium]|nr:beta-lactamase family protein [Acidimicrobiales bacterium]
MSRRRAGSALAVLVALLLATGATACGDGDPSGDAGSASSTTAPVFEPDDPSAAEASAAVAEIVAGEGDDGEPGCAVSAVVDGEVVFEGGYGTADLATGEAIDAATTFDIASVSKQFTAAAVYLLADRGELSLDDEVHEHLPELPDYGAAITLDDLVHHTSGLTDYTELLAEDFDDTDVTTTAQALEALAGADELAFEPGAAFEYSNTNYFLLGQVVERVDGRTLADFLADEVFGPLGMDQTVVRDDADLVVDAAAEGYAADGEGGFEANTTNWEQAGDGAVWSSVRDLQRWAANLETFALGGPPLEEGLLTPGPVLDEEGYGYGGGLTLGDGLIEHSGAWAGFSSDFLVAPDSSTSVVVLCNRDDAEVYDLALEVLEAT